jgi:hypothetical protein
MKRLLIATAVLASSLAVVAPAGAQARSCRVLYGVVARYLRAQNTTCYFAQQLASDEWNYGPSHLDWPGGRNGGAWRVTWWIDSSGMPPMTWYRATQGRAVVTWEQGT